MVSANRLTVGTNGRLGNRRTNPMIGFCHEVIRTKLLITQDFGSSHQARLVGGERCRIIQSVLATILMDRVRVQSSLLNVGLATRHSGAPSHRFRSLP